MPTQNPTISFQGFTLDLVAPASFALREDVISTWSEANNSAQTRRAFAFAIGVCCPEIARRAGARYDGGSAMEFGAKIYDYLRRGGVSQGTLTTAATAAFTACVKSLTNDAPGVSAREDFTGPGEGSPT